METTLVLLEAEHRGVLARLDDVEALLGAPCADLPGFHAFLDRDVAAHFALEEEVLFPVLARHPALAEGPVAIMLREHALFRAQLGLLGDAVDRRDVPAQTAAVVALVALLRAHIAKEDGVLFELARATLSPGELQEIETRRATCAHAASRSASRVLPGTALAPTPPSNGGLDDDCSHEI